jgi:hypothetical protein
LEVEEYLDKMRYVHSNNREDLTLERGKYYLFDDEPAYLYVQRYDGEKGIIPKEVSGKLKVEPIYFLRVMELRTKFAEPDHSRYGFDWSRDGYL